MKNIKVEILVKNKRIKELSDIQREKIKEKIKETYQKQIIRKVVSMIQENKSKEEIMKYLGVK